MTLSFYFFDRPAGQFVTASPLKTPHQITNIHFTLSNMYPVDWMLVQCNPDLVTLNLVTTCDIVTILQRPYLMFCIKSFDLVTLCTLVTVLRRPKVSLNQDFNVIRQWQTDQLDCQKCNKAMLNWITVQSRFSDTFGLHKTVTKWHNVIHWIILCSKFKNDLCKIVTISQVVTKCSVTKLRLHCTGKKNWLHNWKILTLFSLYLPNWFDIFQMGLSSWLYQECKGGYCSYYWWWIRNWKAYVAQIGWFRSNYCYMGCQC